MNVFLSIVGAVLFALLLWLVYFDARYCIEHETHEVTYYVMIDNIMYPLKSQQSVCVRYKTNDDRERTTKSY